MRVSQERYFWIMLLCLTFFCCLIQAQYKKTYNPEDRNRYADPQSVLQKFIEIEVTGDLIESRIPYFVYSTERYALEKKKDPYEKGKLITMAGDSYFIITKYQFGEMKIEGNKAVDRIVSNRIARAEYDSIEVDRKVNDTTEYHLTKQKGKWFVINPPEPRILFENVLKYFKGENTDIVKIENLPTISIDQKKYFQMIRKKLSVLESLK